MKKYLLLFVFALILSGCNSGNQAKETNIEQETTEIVEFDSVEDAELYFWEKAKNDMPYSEIDKILSNGSFVSRSDYDKVIGWYEELERTNEIVQNVNESMKDWTVEDGLFIEKDGGLITRYDKSVTGEVAGYELEFVKEDDTFKLEKITILQ